MATQQEINFIRLVDAGLWAAAASVAPSGSTFPLSLPAASLLGLPQGSTVTQGAAALTNVFNNSQLPGGIVICDIDGSYTPVICDIDGTNSVLMAY